MLIAAAAFACGAPLTNSQPSLEELCNAVLDGLRRQDREALWALMVTREEHETLLWEQLPSRNQFPFDYVRSLNERNSREGLDNAIRRYGGTDFELVSIEFGEPAEQYLGFALHFGAKMTVRRLSDGEQGILPILDVILEYDGQWKLMNYEE